MDNENLNKAKISKNDEFYTAYSDIQVEINAYVEYNPDVFRDKVILLPCDDPEWSNFTKFFAQNFDRYGIKKLISTSFAADAKDNYSGQQIPYQVTFFEMNGSEYDENKTRSHGKIFTLERDKDNSGKIDIDDLEWSYLEGDGDFRSDEVTALRDEADIVVTNPAFSTFKQFLSWILEANKKFIILGNINSVTAKDVFPLIRDNKMWLGESIHSGDREFRVPDSYPLEAAGCRQAADGTKYIRVKGVRWFTNIEHGLRHQPMQLMTMADNLKFTKHKDFKETGYVKFDNYDAIMVPFTDVVPSDYEGVMGVPITFLDKYCPEQFEIIGLIAGNIKGLAGIPTLTGKNGPYINGKLIYGRILVKKRDSQ